mgnify:CR=1
MWVALLGVVQLMLNVRRVQARERIQLGRFARPRAFAEAIFPSKSNTTLGFIKCASERTWGSRLRAVFFLVALEVGARLAWSPCLVSRLVLRVCKGSSIHLRTL